MKRALLLFTAALLVLLLVPSTDSVAGSSRTFDQPVPITPPETGPVGADSEDGNGDADDGDADGLSGYKNRKDWAGGDALTVGDPFLRTTVWRVWWNLMVWIR